MTETSGRIHDLSMKLHAMYTRDKPPAKFQDVLDSLADVGASPEEINAVVGRLWLNIPREARGGLKGIQEAGAKQGDLERIFINSPTHFNAALDGAAHALQNGLCSEHEVAMLECGCLAKKRRTHCFSCGGELKVFGGSEVCPTCDDVLFLDHRNQEQVPIQY